MGLFANTTDSLEAASTILTDHRRAILSRTFRRLNRLSHSHYTVRGVDPPTLPFYGDDRYDAASEASHTSAFLSHIFHSFIPTATTTMQVRREEGGGQLRDAGDWGGGVEQHVFV